MHNLYMLTSCCDLWSPLFYETAQYDGKTTFSFIMPPPLIGGGIKRWCCLTSVCLTSDVCRVHRA